MAMPSASFANAQAPKSEDLFYLYQGKRIPLNLRQDAFVVKGEAGSSTRGGTRGGEESPDDGGEPFFMRLQQYVSSGSRGPESAVANAEVKPLGENYALVNLPNATPAINAQAKQELSQIPGVSATLPVMTRQGRSEAIALPNEIIISFDRNLPESQVQAILKNQNLEVIRKVAFTQNRYVVRSTSASGTAVLNVANQLYSVTGVRSATPNFIQSVSNRIAPLSVNALKQEQSAEDTENAVNKVIGTESTSVAKFKTALLPLQWQLDSGPLSQSLKKDTKSGDCSNGSNANCNARVRTDIRAPEAWQQSNGGQGVVVAVLDTTIQWNHPDLKNNLYNSSNLSDRCPGEVHGWNFSALDTVSSNNQITCPGKPDTRISKKELNVLAPILKDTFRLSDERLRKKYSQLAERIKVFNCSSCSDKQIANEVREQLRHNVTGEFHGTWAAGTIAARSTTGRGLMGVAPNVKILPVRTAGLGGEFTTEEIVSSIGYAATRGADIINMSFGGSVPLAEITDEISYVLALNPKLVLVASAGNEGDSEDPSVKFPASVPGVVSVGATNLAGNRTFYSNYGTNLAVVAPGGDLDSPEKVGGILTTGGTWIDGFWQGTSIPKSAWGSTLDKKGGYIWVQGTSFSAPIVSGVLALMKGEDSKRNLGRQQLIDILQDTASYQGLAVSEGDRTMYDGLRSQSALPANISAEKYFFGSGLVNAEAAVSRVKQVSAR